MFYYKFVSIILYITVYKLLDRIRWNSPQAIRAVPVEKPLQKQIKRKEQKKCCGNKITILWE